MYNDPLYISAQMAQRARHSADLSALKNQALANSAPIAAKVEARNILKEVYIQKEIYRSVLARFKTAHPEHTKELDGLEAKVSKLNEENQTFQKSVTDWAAAKI